MKHLGMKQSALDQAYKEGQDAYILGNAINPYRSKINRSMADDDMNRMHELIQLADQWEKGYVSALSKE